MIAATREDIRQIITTQTNLKGVPLDRLFHSAARRIATYCLPHHLKWITEVPTTVASTDNQDYIEIPDGVENVSALFKDDFRIDLVNPDEFARAKILYSGVSSAHPQKGCVMQERIYIEPTPASAGDLTVIGSINPTYIDDATGISGILDSMPDYYDGAMKSAIRAEYYTNDPTRFNQHEATFERAMIRNIEAAKARGQAVVPLVDEQTQGDFGSMSPGGGGGFRYDTGWPDGYY